MKRQLSRTPHARLGMIGTVILGFALIAALSGDGVVSSLGTTYRADFAEAGGLTTDDNVVIAGVAVGQIRSIDLVGDHVEVQFSLSDTTVALGDRTRASIQAQTVLGKKDLALDPAGQGRLADGGAIPVSRTTPPYDITQALSDLTQTVSDVDVSHLSVAMNTLSETLTRAAPNVSPALNGVLRLSQAINGRDAQLRELLRHSANVTGVLAQRDKQVQTLLSDGTALINELNTRSDDIAALLSNASAVSAQVSGLVKDNEKQIGPAFDQLNGALQLLRDNKKNIDDALASAVPLVRELGGSVSAFPGFSVMLVNIPPTDVVPGLPALLMGGKQR